MRLFNLRNYRKTNPGSKSNAEYFTPGTVRNTIEEVELLGVSGDKVLLSGVQPKSYHGEYKKQTGDDYYVQISILHSIKFLKKNEQQIAYTVEWVSNIDRAYFIWPHKIDSHTKTTITKTFFNEENGITQSHVQGQDEYSRRCAKLTIDSKDVYIGHSKFSSDLDEIMPGFIIYKGNPSEDFRKKVRNCFSFSFGRPIIYMGYSEFSEQWHLVSFKAISAYTFDGKAFTLPTLPPAPIGNRGLNDLCAQKIQNITSSLYTHYDSINFSHLSWLYWHAVTAPVHMAAANFGAVIESIQESYIENNKKKFSAALMKKPEWKKFRASVIDLINELSLGEVEREILSNKVGTLNKLPQNQITELFFIQLNLVLSTLDVNSWVHRNNAAHGNEIEYENYINLIRETKLLKLLFHRIVLTITSASDSYFDYYSLGHPIRPLEEPAYTRENHDG